MHCSHLKLSLKGLTFASVYIQEFGFYVLLGACQSKEIHLEATKDKGTVSGTQLSFKFYFIGRLIYITILTLHTMLTLLTYITYLHYWSQV